MDEWKNTANVYEKIARNRAKEGENKDNRLKKVIEEKSCLEKIVEDYSKSEFNTAMTR